MKAAKATASIRSFVSSDMTAPEMPKDPFIREKFTSERNAARKFAQEYFERYPKDRYPTEVESWRLLQSATSNL
jgi:hypothetical protein